jgi:uncharacterized protein
MNMFGEVGRGQFQSDSIEIMAQLLARSNMKSLFSLHKLPTNKAISHANILPAIDPSIFPANGQNSSNFPKFHKFQRHFSSLATQQPSQANINPHNSPSDLSPASSSPKFPDTPFFHEDAQLTPIRIISCLGNHFKLFNPNAVSPAVNLSLTQTPIKPSSISPSQSVSANLSDAYKPGFLEYSDAPPNSVVIYLGSSMLFFTHAAFFWSPKTWADVTIQSLRLIEIMEPRPELILFGSGAQTQHLPTEIEQYLDSQQVKYEVSDSMNAAGTFNLLAEEGRMVCAAILPRSVAPEEGEDVPLRNGTMSLRKYHQQEKPSIRLRQKIEEDLKQRGV